MSGWVQAGTSPGCRQWMGRQVEVETSQTELCLSWMSIPPSTMLGALGAAGRWTGAGTDGQKSAVIQAERNHKEITEL